MLPGSTQVRRPYQRSDTDPPRRRSPPLPTSSRPWVRSALLAMISLLALGPLAAGAAEPAATIVDFGFEPAGITITAGQTVVPTNRGIATTR